MNWIYLTEDRMGKIKTNVGYAIHKRNTPKKMICEGQKYWHQKIYSITILIILVTEKIEFKVKSSKRWCRIFHTNKSIKHQDDVTVFNLNNQMKQLQNKANIFRNKGKFNKSWIINDFYTLFSEKSIKLMKVKPLKIWVIQLASLIQRNIYKNYYILGHKENYNTFRKTEIRPYSLTAMQ